MKRRRIAGMIGGGLALALLLYAGVSLTDGAPASGDERGAASGEPVAASLTPVTFTQISETRVAGGAEGGSVLRLSGIAEPAATVALLDRGETVRQVRATPQGVWTATLDVTGPGMAIEAVLYDVPSDIRSDTGFGATSIRGVETVFRIRQPGTPSPALIMVSAPGAPTRLVQSPFGGLPSAGALSIGAIDYDDTGGVIVSGRSAQAGRVRLYVSNAAIGETRVGADGVWTYIASSVMPLGEYEVRAELLSDAAVNPVVSVPFERLPPLPEPGPGAATDDGALSVAFTPYRWQIRRSLVGGGQQSTVVFAPDMSGPEEPGPG
ncbi:MAG: hypothetical protein AAF311_08275 [Pseudomonadota bacterium]